MTNTQESFREKYSTVPASKETFFEKKSYFLVKSYFLYNIEKSMKYRKKKRLNTITKKENMEDSMGYFRTPTFFTLLLLGLLIPFNLSLPAQENEKEKEVALSPRHYVFNFALWYPTSTNRTKHDTSNISLTLFYGRLGAVKGLDLAIGVTVLEDGLEGFQIAALSGTSGKNTSGVQAGGLVSVTGEDLRGAQISGLMNVTGSKGQGFQIAGGMNVSGETLRGFQASGLFNIVGEKFNGFQATGGFNIAGESAEGFQAAGLFNIVGEDFEGLQASGLFNIVGEDCKGLQMSGLFNIAGENLNGAQIGVFNIAPYFRDAVQIGLINVSAEMRGFQLGLVNWNGETFGIPVGLVNVSKRDGHISWVSWGSSISGLNSGVKFEVDKFYSIVSLGYWNFYLDIGSSLSYAGHYGYYIFQDTSSFSVDIGYMYMDNKKLFRSHPQEPDQHVIPIRALMTIALSDRISLVGGGGLSYILDRHKSIGRGEVIPIFFFGVEVF